MGKITDAIIRRIIVSKIKAFFSGLFDVKASEAYAGWSAVVMKVLMLVPAAAPVITILDWLAEHVFNVGDTETLVGILITYAAMRMTKKAANAPAG